MKALLLCSVLTASLAVASPSRAGTLTTLLTFGAGPAGADPAGALVQDADNDVFGVTANAVYEASPASGRYKVSSIWTFRPGSVGIAPAPGLAGVAGALFGATDANRMGENYGCGSVFEVTGQGTAKPISRLNTSNKGCYPNGPVTISPAGDVFATFSNGGTAPGGFGSILRFHPAPQGSGQYATQLLYSFRGKADGLYPSVPLLLAKSGRLYGTALASPNGNTYPTPVFELRPPEGARVWQFSIIHRFARTECVDGIGQLVEGKDGILYGPCQQTPAGTPDQYGDIFSLTPPATPGGAWTYTKLHTFRGGSDGAYPVQQLSLDGAGNLYGSTTRGHGTIFRLARPQGSGSAWTLQTLWRFSGADGDQPSSPLLISADGTILGTTSAGGAANGGTLFELVP